MKLTEVEKEMHELANIGRNGGKIDPDRLDYLAGQIPRRKVLSRAESTSQKMTPKLNQEIRNFHLTKIQYNKTWSQKETANHFNVNPGRVSEAVRGKRQ